MRFLLALLAAAGAAAQGQRPPEPLPTFESLLKKIASAPADPCDWQNPDLSGRSDLEFRIFNEADKAVVAKLNESPIASPSAVPSRATAALRQLQGVSAEANKGWPEDRRFQFKVIELPPGLLVKMTFRNWATFSYFAHPEVDENTPVSLWHDLAAADSRRSMAAGLSAGLDLFPLHRGPSNRPRFLAVFYTSWCNGPSGGISYSAYEWNLQDAGMLSWLIRIEGEMNLADPNRGLRTEGALIRLPYCWRSAVDTWDSPSLCATNSYDLSGDRVRLVGNDYNLPDLLPVARAIQYAQAGDYPAVLAYCGSAEVARQIVQSIPPNVSGIPFFTVKQIGASRKSVDLGSGPEFHFEVEKRGDRWLVVSFRMD